jgi:hypothetical protein
MDAQWIRGAHCRASPLLRIVSEIGFREAANATAARPSLAYAGAGSSRHVVVATFSATGRISLLERLKLRSKSLVVAAIMANPVRTQDGRISGNSDICRVVESK